MPNPACEVKDGAGAYQATTNGVDVTPTNTITIRLIDTSADSWSIECVYTDELSVAATVTSSLVIDTALRTATFTAPAAGRTYIFRSRVNNGVGPNGRVLSSYTTTFGVYTLTAGSKRVIAANETTEGGAFGWVKPVNELVRSPGGGGGSPDPLTVQDIFGADLAHFWGDDYDGETGSFADQAGSADAAYDGGADETTSPRQGSINGHACPVFNGIEDGLIGPDITTLDGLNSYCILFCFRIDGGLAYGAIIEKGDSYQFGIQFSSQHLYAFVNGGAQDLDGVTAVNEGKWHRGILNVNAGAASLYLDGNLEGTATFSALTSGTTKGVQLGYQGGEPALTAMRGAITSVGIVTRAATALEVEQLDSVLQHWIHGVDVPAGFSYETLDTTNGTAPQDSDEVVTTDATQTNIGDAITLPTDSVTTVDVAVQCIQSGAGKAKIFNVRRSFLNNGGSVTDGTQIDLLTAEELGGALAASVAITRTSTTVQPKVTGVAATELRWYLISQAMRVTAATSLLPDAPISIAPDTGDPAGGDAVVITVTDSTGLTGAKLGGVALAGFAIVDGTHVSGTTGAHAAGAVDVVVTNASGDSGPLVGGFTYASSFSFAAFNWALDIRGADRTGASIPGTASAGTSGTHSWDSTAADTIGAGATMNSVATYDNDSDAMWSFDDSWALSDLVAGAKNAYTAVIVLRANAISTAGSAYHNRKYLIGTGGGSAMWGIGLYDNAGTGKVVAGHFDGGSFREREVTVVVGTPIIVQVRLSTASGGSLEIRANKGAWSSLTGAGVIDTVTAYLTNVSANGRGDADIARMSISPTAITDGDLDDICDYLGGLYGITV